MPWLRHRAPAWDSPASCGSDDHQFDGRVMLFIMDGVRVAITQLQPNRRRAFITTPKNAIQVNNEIWVSDQILDAVLSV